MGLIPSFLWSLRICLTKFYRDASLSLLQLVNEWLNFIYSRSHAFRYGRKNTNSGDKHRTHDFRTSRSAGYQLDHSGDKGIRTCTSWKLLDTPKKAGRPGSSEVPRNPLTRWDVSSIPANGIFLTKKLKNKIKMPNGWRTIKSLVHKIRLHGRRGKGMAEFFSREKLRHAPQKEGG